MNIQYVDISQEKLDFSLRLKIQEIEQGTDSSTPQTGWSPEAAALLSIGFYFLPFQCSTAKAEDGCILHPPVTMDSTVRLVFSGIGHLRPSEGLTAYSAFTKLYLTLPIFP